MIFSDIRDDLLNGVASLERKMYALLIEMISIIGNHDFSIFMFVHPYILCDTCVRWFFDKNFCCHP